MTHLSADPIENLNAETLTRMLSQSIGPLTVQDVQPTPVGTGQMANSYRLSLTYADADPAAPRSVIAKVPSTDETSRQMAATTGAYLREVQFYRQLAEVAATRTPRCYYADIAEDAVRFVLLLEDLAPAQVVEQLGGCSADRVALALGEAAALHGPSWGNPALAAADWLPVEQVWNQLGGAIGDLTSLWLDRFGDRISAEHVPVITQLAAAVPAWLATLGEHRCLWHGDFRLDNLLFDAQNGAIPVAVVDWQSVAAAPGIIDVSYFLGTSMDAGTRAACERELVADYYRRLCGHGVQGYSFANCWREYQAHALFGLVLTIPVSLGVQRTERGDAMFATMARRVADQILANDSFAALASL
jgi:aminoglycoside/choline kinase family phosphotransferase